MSNTLLILMIKYTKHALENLTKRRITKDRVKKCLENPDIKAAGVKGKTIFLKDFGKNFLRVIAIKEKSDWVIITEHWIDKKRVKR